MKIRYAVFAAVIGALALPLTASAQAAGPDTGTGGAKEKMKPSTTGVDTRPREETARDAQPAMQSIQAQPPVPPPVPPAPGTTR